MEFLEMHDGLKIVAAFLDTISSLHAPASMYRGHADASWDVIPSAFRDDGAGITTQSHLVEWKLAARRFGEPHYRDIDWLVLAQHYGVSTTLLDWSKNPLVALYFACRKVVSNVQEHEPAGSVIMIQTLTLTPGIWLDSNPIFTPIAGQPVLIDSEVMNKRTLAQDSVMTLHQKDTSKLTDIAANTIFQIEPAQKWSVTQALYLIGVSSDRIFADITEVARDFGSELRRRKQMSDILGDPSEAPPFVPPAPV